jgi:hypothetical protein
VQHDLQWVVGVHRLGRDRLLDHSPGHDRDPQDGAARRRAGLGRDIGVAAGGQQLTHDGSRVGGAQRLAEAIFTKLLPDLPAPPGRHDVHSNYRSTHQLRV